MTPVTFPLLKLPLLTIKHVFLVMTMEQIYDFSYCSKKAQRILKSCNVKNVEISVYFIDFAENLTFGTIREETVVRNCQYELGTPKTHQVKGGVDIRSNDGKLATIFGSGVRSCATEIHVWD
ncbi:unnamed protein product [Caenorhabditis brenneri]